MAMYPEDRNGKTTYTVVVSTRINGIQVNRKRRNISSKVIAKRIEDKLRIELHLLKSKPKRFKWDEWSQACIERMKIEFKISTINTYVGNLGKWVTPHLKELYLDEITGSIVHDVVYNKIENVGADTRRTVLKQIKRIFEMAVDDGIISRNPARPINVKVPEAKQLVLNQTEINVLLHEAKSRNHAFFNQWVLALLTGMRNGELHALMWTDIDFDNKVISVTKSWSITDGIGPTKNTKNRYVPISLELEMFLRNLKSRQLETKGRVLELLQEWLNGEQAKILKEFCRDIGITPIKFHDLRATFITQLLIKGVPVAKVMLIVGHSSLKTTMKYLRLVAQDTIGATEALGIILPREFETGNVVNLFQR